MVNVRRLNLLHLVPGGHIGRFVIWTEGAFALLDAVFGSFDKAAVNKKDYMFVLNHYSRIIPTNACRAACPNVTRLVNSSEIQSVVRPANAKTQKRPWTQHKNPLRNKAVPFLLNPNAKTLRRQELRAWPI